METGYRIVEMRDGKVMSLFHGTDRSREIPLGVWHKANVKMVRDGSNGEMYLSGWHYLKSREEAVEFFERRFRIKDDRYIVKCRVRGNIRRKWSGNCWLADEIKIEQRALEGLE
jgi:hypothetical protein